MLLLMISLSYMNDVIYIQKPKLWRRKPSFTAVERDLPLEEEKGWRNLRPTHKMYLVCWFVLVALATKQFLLNSPLIQFP